MQNRGSDGNKAWIMARGDVSRQSIERRSKAGALTRNRPSFSEFDFLKVTLGKSIEGFVGLGQILIVFYFLGQI
jgi:hypothetical protein